MHVHECRPLLVLHLLRAANYYRQALYIALFKDIYLQILAGATLMYTLKCDILYMYKKLLQVIHTLHWPPVKVIRLIHEESNALFRASVFKLFANYFRSFP